jgi:DNA-binding MarR family transcriptional regulator
MAHTSDLGYLLHHLATALDRQSDQLLQDRLGIGFSQFKILLVLKKHGGVQQRFIADYLGQTEASISRQIKLMQDGGVVDSKVSPRNRRERVTSITNKGLRTLEDAFSCLNYYHQPVFARLSGKQQLQLMEMLESMHMEVCQGEKPGSCQHQFD